MPAVEHQLSLALLHILKTRSIPFVLNIGERFNGDDFGAINLEQLNSPENVSTNNMAYDAVYFNNLIINAANINSESVTDQLPKLMNIALELLRDEGILIVRQNISSIENRREILAKLTDFFDLYRKNDDDNNGQSGFDFHAMSAIDDSVYAHQNWFDVFWILRKRHYPPAKVDDASGNLMTFRDFLDKRQYTNTGIALYEWIFGDGFISPGGASENLKFLSRLSTSPGQTMLDIGVGIGGGAQQAAKQLGIHVIGVDLSSNMLSIAIDRQHIDRDTRVRYMIADVIKYDYPSNHFDYVYSRDCIQHITQMDLLFQKIYNCLKPGGKLLITCYGTGAGKPTEQFTRYVDDRQYNMKTAGEFVKMAKSVGLIDVNVDNMTSRFREILHEEMDNIQVRKDKFVKQFSIEDYDHLMSGWQDKLAFIDMDNHNWIMIEATKPL